MKARIVVLALVLSLTLGLVQAGAAETDEHQARAAKKKKRGNRIVVTAGPQPLNQATGNGPSLRYGLTALPFSIGKKGKGKLVAPGSVSVTISATTPAPGGLDDQQYLLSDPSGLTVPLGAPGSPQTTTLGPLTFTPDSPNGLCLNPPCPNPLQNVAPPGFGGTVGVPALAHFTFRPVSGTWTLLALDTDPNNGPATVTTRIIEFKYVKIVRLKGIRGREIVLD